MTEPLDLAPIEARATAATTGPWERHPQYGPHFLANITGAYLEGVGDLNFGTGEQADADEEFVRHAQPDVTALIAEVKRLRAAAPPADAITVTRDQLAALLAHHADVIATRWDAYAPDPAAYALRTHAGELTADEETPFVRELLDSMLSFEAEAATPSAPADQPSIRDAMGPADGQQKMRLLHRLYASTAPVEEPADTDLRDRIATAISKWHRDPDQPLYVQGADAVLAVLPAPADRAGVLQDAALAAEHDPYFDAYGARVGAWLRSRATHTRPTEITHGTPPFASSLTACCGRPLQALPPSDRLAKGTAPITCPGAVEAEHTPEQP